MKSLTFTLCKEHCELYTEIDGSIAVNRYQIEIAQKDIILLSNVSIIGYKAGKCTGVENNKFIHLQNLSYQNATHSCPRHYFYRAWYNQQLTWKDDTNQVNLAPWLIQNIP